MPPWKEQDKEPKPTMRQRLRAKLLHRQQQQQELHGTAHPAPHPAVNVEAKADAVHAAQPAVFQLHHHPHQQFPERSAPFWSETCARLQDLCVLVSDHTRAHWSFTALIMALVTNLPYPERPLPTMTQPAEPPLSLPPKLATGSTKGRRDHGKHGQQPEETYVMTHGPTSCAGAVAAAAGARQGRGATSWSVPCDVVVWYPGATGLRPAWLRGRRPSFVDDHGVPRYPCDGHFTNLHLHVSLTQLFLPGADVALARDTACTLEPLWGADGILVIAGRLQLQVTLPSVPSRLVVEGGQELRPPPPYLAVARNTMRDRVDKRIASTDDALTVVGVSGETVFSGEINLKDWLLRVITKLEEVHNERSTSVKRFSGRRPENRFTEGVTAT